MSRKGVVVFDVGGTYFRYNVLDDDGQLLEDIQRNKVESPNYESNSGLKPEKLTSLFIEKIVSSVKGIKERNPQVEIEGIGVAFPGPVDSNGVVIAAPPLWSDLVKDYPLKKDLERILSHKVFVLNDVSAGCWYYKDKVKSERFCLITVSTGIGNKVFDAKHEEKIITLKNGFGGEIGHAFVNKDEYDLPCDCGARGHLSSISSGRGAEKFAKIYSRNHIEKFNSSILFSLSCGDPERIDNVKLVKATKERDEFAQEIIRKTSLNLAIMIQQMYMAIGVEKFIIIGGFALSFGEIYREMLIDHLKDMKIWGIEKDKIKDLIELGEDDDTINQKGIGEFVFYNLEGGK